MQAATIERIITLYGLCADTIGVVQKGYRNESYHVLLHDGRDLNLILYKHEPDMLDTLRRLNEVSDFAYTCGLPVRHTFDPRILQIKYHGQTRYVGLYHYISGFVIPWEAYTRHHLRLVGQSLAALHRALSTYQNDNVPPVEDQCISNASRMYQYFTNEDVVKALSSKLSLRIRLSDLRNTTAILLACKRLPGRHILHMDFVRSNLLFNQSRDTQLAIAGILDFEKVAVGSPLFDVARSTAFLFVDSKYKTTQQVQRFFLQSGYMHRGGGSLPRLTVRQANSRLKLFDWLITMFLTYDFYKFLRHNPYESLVANEHFVRTCSLLLERGVITTTTSSSHTMTRIATMTP